jgi:dephospho-CoA kinase
MDPRPFLIGLTGNIATGKSTVAAMLARRGAEAIDADRVAHGVMRPGQPAHRRIVEAFGPEILTPEGEIDRQRLGAIVFSDPEALRRLEDVVHPATLAAIEGQVAASAAPVVVIEAIKLLESGLGAWCDTVWVTVCRREQQIQRVMERGFTRPEAEQRVAAQPPQQEKVARAHVVIDTSGTRAQTERQVQEAWERLQAKIEREGWRSR